jgi:hypothetical protein
MKNLVGVIQMTVAILSDNCELVSINQDGAGETSLASTTAAMGMYKRRAGKTTSNRPVYRLLNPPNGHGGYLFYKKGRFGIDDSGEWIFGSEVGSKASALIAKTDESIDNIPSSSWRQWTQPNWLFARGISTECYGCQTVAVVGDLQGDEGSYRFSTQRNDGHLVIILFVNSG